MRLFEMEIVRDCEYRRAVIGVGIVKDHFKVAGYVTGKLNSYPHDLSTDETIYLNHVFCHQC